MVNIAVLASFNTDLVMRAERRPAAGETLQGVFGAFLGGKGFNQAVAARRLGADVAVVGRVGDDEFGRHFLAALDREDIDRTAVAIDADAGTGVASIVVEPDGANTILQDPRANRRVSPDDVKRATPFLAGADIAMMQLETSAEGLLAFAVMAGAAGTRTLLNPAPATVVSDELLSLVDIIVANAIEAETLTHGAVSSVESAFAASDSIRARGPGIAVVTLGGDGAAGSTHNARAHEAALRVPVVDTVGAGDAFCAALAVRLAEGAAFGDAIRFANAAGALACTREGAEPSMPRRDEVEALLEKGLQT